MRVTVRMKNTEQKEQSLPQQPVEEELSITMPLCFIGDVTIPKSLVKLYRPLSFLDDILALPYIFIECDLPEKPLGSPVFQYENERKIYLNVTQDALIVVFSEGKYGLSTIDLIDPNPLDYLRDPMHRGAMLEFPLNRIVDVSMDVIHAHLIIKGFPKIVWDCYKDENGQMHSRGTNEYQWPYKNPLVLYVYVPQQENQRAIIEALNLSREE